MSEKHPSSIEPELIQTLEDHIEGWKPELYSLLPGLSEDIEI